VQEEDRSAGVTVRLWCDESPLITDDGLMSWTVQTGIQSRAVTPGHWGCGGCQSAVPLLRTRMQQQLCF
jgi:hypothetical protein